MNKYISRLFALEEKVAVVIGGGGHLCGAMAEALALAGCRLAIVDLRKEKARAVADELSKRVGSTVLGIQGNASVKEDLVKALAEVTARFGVVDILINGAGTNSPTPFFQMSESEWDDVMSSQIKATMLGCQVFGEAMTSQGHGAIINISSASAGPPLSKAFPYSCAKAAILNLTMNLAREWARYGVRVNAIRPGFFPTQWNRENFITPEREADILRHTPMGRFGEPEELSGALLWLVSDAASFVTGSEIAVDGGFSCMTI